jgi:hypothetical protein
MSKLRGKITVANAWEAVNEPLVVRDTTRGIAPMHKTN